MRLMALRVRLLAASAISITMALALAGLGISALFATHIEKDLASGLRDEMNRLVALVRIEGETVSLSQPMPDPRYLRPYGELYWQINDPQGAPVLWSRSVWDSTLDIGNPPLVPGQPLETALIDPEGTPALARIQRLQFEAGNGTRVLDLIVAEDRGALDIAIAKFRQDLLSGLGLLGIMLVVASWVQVSVGLRPLAAIRRGVGEINSGRRKTLGGTFPLEVMPLVNEVNALLASQEASIGFARARAADLAHGLKTSLTVLNLQAAQLRQHKQGEIADTIEGLSRSMAETIDHQLALARLRHRSRSKHYAVALGPALDQIVSAVRATPAGRARRWLVNAAGDLTLDLDPADLIELLGVLLDNAAKWAKEQISITAASAGKTIVITIDDDGPGVAEAQVHMLAERGKRLDEVTAGSGLGLAIAEEIVTLNAGTICFSRAPLGGLRARLSLPAGAETLLR
ncbi:MAG: sensor histidine kinase [Alphaproteobacteria bacterium]|nr:sensor histidine kinase [Alphaproteobacteria bacterium]